MGGRPTTLGVYLAPFSRYTWGRALLATVGTSYTGRRPKTAKSSIWEVGGRKIFLKIHHKSIFNPIELKFGGLVDIVGPRRYTKLRAIVVPPSGVINR